MSWEGLTFVAYELTRGAVTGFKIYRQFEQVGTIEKRNDMWIAAFASGFKVVTFRNESFEICVNTISKFI